MSILTQPRFNVDNLKHDASLLLQWAALYFAPTLSVIGAVLFVVLSDLITGTIAARKRGDFSSKGLKSSVPKFIVYFVAVMVANVVQRMYLSQIPAVKIIAGLIIWIEVRSINENIEESTGVNLFQTLVDKIKKIL